MQQGRTSEAEVSARKLWGKAKVESAMADLKAGSVETVKGDTKDASWGELFGKRYRKGMQLEDCGGGDDLWMVIFIKSGV